MLFSIPQNGELTLRKFGDSKLLITEDAAMQQMHSSRSAGRQKEKAS